MKSPRLRNFVVFAGALALIASALFAFKGYLFEGVTTRGAGITLVQKASSTVTSATALSSTFPGNVTAGDLIVVSVALWPNNISSVTDSRGNIYSTTGVLTDAGSAKTAVYYATSTTSGPDTITVTGSASGNEISIVMAEFSGVSQTAPMDVETGRIGTNSPASPGAFTPTANGDLIIGEYTHDSSVQTTNPGAGFTTVGIASDDPASHQPLAMEYEIQSAAASINPSFTFSNNDSWGMNGVAFKAATGIVHVQTKTGFTNGATSVTANVSSTTAGDTLIVGVIGQNGDITSITDSASDAFTLAGSVSSSGQFFDVYYAKNIAGGATSVTANFPFGFSDLIVSEWSGLDPSNPLDVVKTNDNGFNSGSSYTSGVAATTTQASELLWGFSANKYSATGVWSPAAGWTNRMTNDTSFLQDQVVAATGAYAATGTISGQGGSSEVFSILATFKAQTATPGSGDVVLLWDGANVPSGWTCISCTVTDPFYQVFPRANSAYGASTAGSDTGTHTATYVSQTTGAATAVDSQAGSNYPNSAHVHPVTNISVSTDDIRPPFKNLKFIKANNPSTLPAGVIGMFDVSSSSLPSGWTYYSAMANEYLRGENATTTGGSATHTHTITATLAAPPNAELNANRNSLTVAGSGHTHTVSGPTPAAANAPPYINVVFAQLSATTSTITNGLIAMFGATPGGDWVSLSDVGGAFNGRFIQGSDTYGATGGSATHTHATTTIVSSGPSTTTSDPRSGTRTNAAASNHTHTVTFTTDTQSSLPKYRDIIFAKYVNLAATLTEDHYQWYANGDVLTPTSSLAATDASATVNDLVAVRLRINVSVSAATLAAGQKVKLQYATATSGPWSDVGSSGSSTIWKGFDNPSVSDGATLTSLLLPSSTVAQRYSETEPTVGTPTSTPVGKWAEWDWPIYENSPTPSTTYYFRMALDSGTALDAYNRYPTIKTGPAITILFWDGGTLPSGWTCLSCASGDPFYQIFPMGSSTYNNLTAGSDTGTHTVTYVSQTTGATVGVANAAGTDLPDGNHVHPVSNVTISTDDIKPPYMNLRFIGATNPALIPAGAIGIFDLASSSLPSGWSYYSAMAGRYLRGENATTTGGSATHTHTITATIGAAPNALARLNSTFIRLADNGHTHTVSGTTPAAANAPPFINAVFAKLSADATPPNDLIGIFTGTPPTGWTSVSGVGGAFNGRFVQGSDSYGTTGGSATHTHATTTITSSGPSATILDAKASGGGGLPGATDTHTHDFTFTTDSQSSLPAYREVVFGKYTAASPTLTEAHYQWFVNANSTTPGASTSSLDSAVLGVASGTILRLRVNLGVTTNPLSTSSQALKLQFAIATSGPWTDLGSTSSVAYWRGFDNSTPADGSTIPSTLLASSTAAESYVEQNPSPTNPTAVASGGFGEWDWVIQRNGAPGSSRYYFRVVKSDGTTLNSYTNYPSITTQTLYQASGTLTSDVIDTAVTNGVAPNSIFFEGSMPANTSVKFQFAASNSSTGPWTYVAWNSVTLACDTASFYTPSGPGSQVEVKAACHNQKRYLRYRAYLATSDNTVTPRVDRVILNYAQ